MEGKPRLLPAFPLARSRSPAARSPSRDNSPLLCWSRGTAAKAKPHAGACSTAVPLAMRGGARALVQPPFLQPPGQRIIVTGVFSCRSLLGYLSQLLGESSPLLCLRSTRHQQDSSISRAMVPSHQRQGTTVAEPSVPELPALHPTLPQGEGEDTG